MHLAIRAIECRWNNLSTGIDTNPEQQIKRRICRNGAVQVHHLFRAFLEQERARIEASLQADRDAHDISHIIVPDRAALLISRKRTQILYPGLLRPQKSISEPLAP